MLNYLYVFRANTKTNTAVVSVPFPLIYLFHKPPNFLEDGFFLHSSIPIQKDTKSHISNENYTAPKQIEMND